MKSIIEQIQDDDPSFDPLTPALEKAGINLELWNAATARVYFDGYYGPISPTEWAEQDEREPYTVIEALIIIRKVLDEVEDYYEDYDGERTYILAADIKAALVAPWYSEIYGVRYP